LQAILQTAIAEADGARQTRTRLLRGARDEEKRIATEKTAAARATFQEAKSRLDMQRALFKRKQVSRATYDQAVRDLGVADANLQAAVRTEELLAAPPLEKTRPRRMQRWLRGRPRSHSPGADREVLYRCPHRRNRVEGVRPAR